MRSLRRCCVGAGVAWYGHLGGADMLIEKPKSTRARRSVPPIVLSDPGRVPPVAIVDSREQTPLVIPGLRMVVRGLTSGDYSFIGGEHLFAIERKSLDDLVGCVTRERERFERELIRLRGYRFRRLLIVGSEADIVAGRYTSAVAPHAVLASLATWEARFDLPVVYADHPEAAGQLVANWIGAVAREIVKDAGATLAGPSTP